MTLWINFNETTKMIQISSSDLDDAKYKHMIIRIHVYNSIYNKPIKLFLNFSFYFYMYFFIKLCLKMQFCVETPTSCIILMSSLLKKIKCKVFKCLCKTNTCTGTFMNVCTFKVLVMLTKAWNRNRASLLKYTTYSRW